jgi:hypothetical protein
VQVNEGATYSQPPVQSAAFPQLICSAYSASNTYFASKAYSTCHFYAMPGDLITVSSCAVSYGDSYMILSDDQANKVAFGDDGCGNSGSYGTQFTYTAVQGGSYSLAQGCYANSACNGTV